MPVQTDIQRIMCPLNLPPSPLRLRQGTNGVEVMCGIRRRWLLLTPEEWVRQHFTAYLVSDLKVPAPMIANERSLRLNGTLRRCDTVVYSRSLCPVAIVEYKAPEVKITREVFEQIMRYNLVLGVGTLIVSNGLTHYCAARCPDGTFALLDHLPDYTEMCGR